MQLIHTYESRLSGLLTSLGAASDNTMMTPLQITKVSNIRERGRSLLNGLSWAKLPDNGVSDVVLKNYIGLVDEYMDSCNSLLSKVA